MAASERNTLIAKIHIGQTQLGLDDTTYRTMLMRVTGKSSCKALQDRQLIAVLDEMKRLGFDDSSGFRKSARADVRMVFALWGQLQKDGKLTSPTPSALRAFCASQTGAAGASKDPEHLTVAECRQVIEALKEWVNRPSKGAQ